MPRQLQRYLQAIQQLQLIQLLAVHIITFTLENLLQDILQFLNKPLVVQLRQNRLLKCQIYSKAVVFMRHFQQHQHQQIS
jgi:hypothetical protein